MKMIIFALLASTLLVSCVSVGKFDGMQMQRDSLQLVSDSMNRVIKDLSKRVSDQIIEHDKDILDLARHQKENSQLQVELKTLTENYARMKDTTKAETLNLISQLEALQKDLSQRDTKLREVERQLKYRDSILQAMKNTINAALVGFADKGGITTSVKNGKVYVTLSNQLLFKSGSTQIDKSGQEALRELTEVLKKLSDIGVEVEGHTDNAKVINQTRFKDNWDLSTLRATEVVRFLTETCGLDPKRVVASGRGEFYPVIEGDDPDSRSANRRTEIMLTPKLDELFQILK